MELTHQGLEKIKPTTSRELLLGRNLGLSSFMLASLDWLRDSIRFSTWQKSCLRACLAASCWLEMDLFETTWRAASQKKASRASNSDLLFHASVFQHFRRLPMPQSLVWG